jgi:DNA-directed RNA polymerase subunit beta'
MSFEPVLVEGKALRLHPLVCKAFNADFDGDQMAIHVPLSIEAQIEARVLMSSVNNILSSANGELIIAPTQDIILGIYYLTKDNLNTHWNGMTFADIDEVRCAYTAGVVEVHTKVKVRMDNEIIETTTGRVLLKEILPSRFPFSKINKTIKEDDIQRIIIYLHSEFGKQDTIKFLNNIMVLGFEYATKAGISICMDDFIIPKQKQAIVEDAFKKVKEYCKSEQLDKEKDEGGTSLSKESALNIWQKASELIDDEVIKEFEKTENSFNNIYMMIHSGARGSCKQLSKIVGILGLTANPSAYFPYSLISNYKEGLSPHEYYLSAFQLYQWLSHVAKFVTDAGWLMRRLVESVHEVVITGNDCGIGDGIYITDNSINEITIQSLEERIIGRISAEEIRHSETGEMLLELNKEITENIARIIIESGIERVKIRSVLTCQSTFGVCAKCYGRDLARGEVVEEGEAIGVIAAQSVGRPITQFVLDMRHLYGQISGKNTQSFLSEIIRLFEGRIPKGKPSINYHEILTESGLREAQLFLLNELQCICRLKRVVVADKHFEVIIRKMTEKIRIEDTGDTLFLKDELVHRHRFIEENAEVQFEGGRPASGKPQILGITKMSLSRDGWISAASFQETTKVLTAAAIAGAVDELKGLKENLIVGRVIPAGTGVTRYKNTFVKRELYPWP